MLVRVVVEGVVSVLVLQRAAAGEVPESLPAETWEGMPFLNVSLARNLENRVDRGLIKEK